MIRTLKNDRRNFAAVCLAATLISACGIMGGTTRTVVQLDTLPPAAHLRPLVVGSVTSEGESVRLTSVGPLTVEGFNDHDRATIEDSLGVTLVAATREMERQSGDLIRIHLLIRKYLLGVSNGNIAILTGVEWVLAGPSNQVLFQDSFYAARECHLPNMCTLGGEKDAIRSAIVKRIAQKAIVAATGGAPDTTDTEGTYSSFESAAAKMPKKIKGWGINESKELDLKWAEMRGPMDWHLYLAYRPH